MFKILKDDHIYETCLTVKQIASHLKRYCDLYCSLKLTDTDLYNIILYFSSSKNEFVTKDSDLNPTILRIVGKKRAYIIAMLLKNNYQEGEENNG